MTATFLHYEDLDSFQRYLKSKSNFYLIFDLGSGGKKNLKQIVNLCITHKNCNGIAFNIDFKKLAFEKLFFYKCFFEQLLISGKSIGIWQVPLCLSRKLLGGYLYMRFFNNRIEESSFQTHTTQKGRRFLPICEKCIDKTHCNGTFLVDLETFRPHIKKSPQPILSIDEHPFDKKLVLLNNMHAAYLRHCRSIKSSVCNRHVYYVSNIDFKSEHSYPNRFVYSCDYPSPDEYEKELKFLEKHTIHKKYVEILGSVMDIDKTSQIAYSLAQKDNTLRESFYMFTPKHYGDKLLKDFHIHYDYPQSIDINFMGLGIDVIHNETKGYKLYFLSQKHFLKKYLEPFGIDLLKINHHFHYLVFRLDKKQTFESYKIEILFEHEDIKHFKNILHAYPNYAENLKRHGLYNFSIEIKNNKISKINIYHQHYTSKSETDEI